jgi:aspartyl-tRNA(Asn)/glutamyl-tRNA(Gln) amidotransferase subunit B
VARYGLPAYDAALLTQSRALAEYFEAAVREAPNAKAVANWIMSDLLRVLPSDDEDAIRTSRIPPAHLAALVRLIDEGSITGKIAKAVFETMWKEAADPRAIVEREGLTQMADAGLLAAVVEQVIAANPRAVEDWRKGKTAAGKALVGAVMKATRGKANPALANQLVEEKLSKL